jgi:hypothetical protein
MNEYEITHTSTSDLITITLPTLQQKHPPILYMASSPRRLFITFNKEDLNVLKMAGIRNMLRMLWYNIIFFICGKVTIKL